MDKKLFIFDVGGVVALHRLPLEVFCEKYHLDYKDVNRDWAAYVKPLLDGFLDLKYFYRMLELNYNVDLSKDPIMVSNYHPVTNEPLKTIVSMLRAKGHRAVTGSNTFAAHWNILLEMKPSPLDGFDHLYASHEMHLSKPSLPFYRYIADAEGFDVKDCFFIDDYPENIKAAKAVGMHGFLYKENNEELLDYLKPYITE